MSKFASEIDELNINSLDIQLTHVACKRSKHSPQLVEGRRNYNGVTNAQKHTQSTFFNLQVK